MENSLTFPGAKQIQAERNRILADYDRAKAASQSHKVPTYHGNAGESAIRDWLLRFLPERYGVTPGYIVAQTPGDQHLPHYDVIIYDKLNAPIIWIEDDTDHSPKGQSRAIPVEYVRGVVEVKATLTTAHAKKAIEHLAELSPYLLGFDEPNERYCKFLRSDFLSLVIFLELKESDAGSKESLDSLLSGQRLRGFGGALILRRGTDSQKSTGRFTVTTTQKDSTKEYPNIGKDLFAPFTFSQPTDAPGDDTKSIVGILQWHSSQFTQFAFDLVAVLNGTYSTERLSSFYGFDFSGTVVIGS